MASPRKRANQKNAHVKDERVEDEDGRYKLPNQHVILEDTREAAVRTAANILDGLAKARELGERFRAGYEDDRASAKGDDSKTQDFLFDYLKLSADYLNQLSKMGARYSAFAHRALENLYAISAPRGSAPGARNIEFRCVWEKPKKNGDRALVFFNKQKFIVQNDVDPNHEIIVEWPCIRGRQSGEWIDKNAILLEQIQPKKRIAAKELEKNKGFRFTCKTEFGAPCVLEVTVDPNAFLKRKYETSFTVRVGPRVRTIPVTIDLRPPPEGQQ
jgi:hypothetical protein